MKLFSLRIVTFALLAFSLLFLSACSEGNTVESTASGTVAQSGEVKGARVWADYNGDCVWDRDEPFTYSSGSFPDYGRYDFSYEEGLVKRFCTDDQGIDNATGHPAIPLSAPKGASNINLLTTMVDLSSSPQTLKQIIVNDYNMSSFDQDLSAVQLTVPTMELLKSTETVLSQLSSLGFSSGTASTNFIDLVTENILTTTNSLDVTTILADTAAEIAADPILLDPLISIDATDIDGPTFIAEVTAIVTQVIAAVSVADTDGDNKLLMVDAQSSIDQNVTAIITAVTVPKLKVASVSIVPDIGTTITLNGDTGTLTAQTSELNNVQIAVIAENTDMVAATYLGATFFATISSDTLTSRRVTIGLTDIDVLFYSDGSVELSRGSASKLTVEAVSATGDLFFYESAANSLYGNPVVSSTSITIDIDDIQTNLLPEAGIIRVADSYSLNVQAIGVPIVLPTISLQLD